MMMRKEETAEKESVPDFPEFHVNPGVVLWMTSLHFCAVYAVAVLSSGAIMWQTLTFSFLLAVTSCAGTTMGAHRLWAHRSYKAKRPLKVLLIVFQTFIVQGAVFRWASWHRVHHKFSETGKDPHNATRGFFYSHIGWILMYDHDTFVKIRELVDVSDLRSDPLIMWQRKYYALLVVFLGVLAPTLLPCIAWNESLVNSFLIAFVLRLTYSYHVTFLVNSAAHIWGYRPYDKGINPAENKLVSLLAVGEGWHNYHHVFPWDYKAAELGMYRWNLTTALIDIFAVLGWAYDLKTTARDMVEQRKIRTGDASMKR